MTETAHLEKLPTTLEVLRRRIDLRQADLAVAATCTQGTISALESGREVAASSELLDRVWSALLALGQQAVRDLNPADLLLPWDETKGRITA